MSSETANHPNESTPAIRRAAKAFLDAVKEGFRLAGQGSNREKQCRIFGRNPVRKRGWTITEWEINTLGNPDADGRDDTKVLLDILEVLVDDNCHVGVLATWWNGEGIAAREAFRQAILEHLPDWRKIHAGLAEATIGAATVTATTSAPEPQSPAPGPEMLSPPPAYQPQSGSVPVPVPVSGARRPLPAAEVKLDDLAQMQIGLAPGSNMADEGAEIYEGTILIGQHDMWNDELKRMVRYCLHQFVLCVDCQEAVPSLPRNTTSVKFQGKEGDREVSIHNRYRDDDLLRSKAFRFDPKGRETLEGSTDKEALLQIKGPCVEGDQVRLEIYSYHLKAMAVGDDDQPIEFDATEDKRIVTNFLRERFVENPASRYVLVRQRLA